jgi:hypothetical protein
MARSAGIRNGIGAIGAHGAPPENVFADLDLQALSRWTDGAAKS